MRMNPERLSLRFRRDAYEKAINRHDATALLKGFAESWPLFERFGFGADGLAGPAVIFCRRLTTPQRAQRALRRSNSEVMMKGSSVGAILKRG